MNFNEFWRSLSFIDKQLFAKNAGTSVGYISNHLAKRPPTRGITKNLLQSLIKNTNGIVSKYDMYAHFFEDVPINLGVSVNSMDIKDNQLKDI